MVPVQDDSGGRGWGEESVLKWVPYLKGWYPDERKRVNGVVWRFVVNTEKFLLFVSHRKNRTPS